MDETNISTNMRDSGSAEDRQDHRRILNPVKHLRWRFLRKHFMVKGRSLPFYPSQSSSEAISNCSFSIANEHSPTCLTC